MDLDFIIWVLARGCNLSYHSKESILFTVDPHGGNINTGPLTRTQYLGDQMNLISTGLLPLYHEYLYGI